MPEIIIVAGPNGAGKTTFANEFLPLELERFVYLNADEIARGLAATHADEIQRNLRAGREMLRQIDRTASQQLDFMFETTLASLTYAMKIPKWQAVGYRVNLFYLRLASAELSIERVRSRVTLGGHGIPEDVIRQRFGREP